MEFDSEEDYEIPNTVNRVHFEETKAEFVSHLDEDTEPEPTIKQTEKSTKYDKLKFYFLSCFINTKSNNVIQRNSSLLNELLVEMDSSLIIDNYLNFMDELESSKNISKFDRNFIIKITINFLLYYVMAYLFLSLIFGLSLYSFPLFVLLSFFICFIYFKMFELFFTNLVLVIRDYRSLLKSLVYQLKEIEMISLASKRRLFVEKSSNKTEFPGENDALNFRFRKHAFFRLRHQFFDIKKLNQSLNLTNLNCICTIATNDLSEIMWQDNEDEIERLTDFFNINCIKSIMKLNFLLVSENLKLILSNYYSLILIDSNIVILLFNMAKFAVKLVSEIFLINNLLRDLKHSLEIVMLASSENSSKNTNKVSSLEHNLSLHLRNAFLNALELEKTDVNSVSVKIKTLNLLKYDFEHSNLWLKQLICNIEGEPLSSSIEKINLNETQPVNTNVESLNLLNNCRVDEVVEDEIFEADTFNLNDFEDKKQELEIDFPEEFLKEKQVILANKNLFYELKYALKTKKNEWIEREKAAKKIKNEQANSESFEHKDEFDGFHLNQNHLLENETLKYKSELRKRRSNARYSPANKNLDETQTLGKKSKYMYEEFNDVSQTEVETPSLKLDQAKIGLGRFSNSVLNEFMLKRNLVINNQDNEEELLFE
jgi:hypothetical protein